jgi:hypothetical protein
VICIGIRIGVKIKNPEQSGQQFKRNKKWQATYIAPLQPHTFAVFPPWRSLAGAGRVGLAGANIQPFYIFARQL